MLRRAAAQTAVLSACVGVVIAAALTAPSAVADDERTHGDTRVVVPRGPGEEARIVSPDARRVERIVAQAAREDQPNKADRHFAEMMIPHHYQAIVMSRLAPDRARDRRIRSIAERIRSEQDLEITAMRGWQGREGLPKTDAREAYQHMLDDPEMLEHMGMATRQEVAALRASEGRGFDRKFLRLMIPHHKGAIRMAEHVAADGRDLFIRQLAIDMISSQSRQIYDMRQIRKSWG